MSLDTNAKLDMSLDDIAARSGGVRGSPGNKRTRGTTSTGVDEERALASVARRVYVGNLTWKVSWQDLKDHFRTAGNVVYADVMRSPVDDRSKGCGIVEFETSEEAAEAIRTLNQTELQGRPIFIREDREDRDVTGGSGSNNNNRGSKRARGFNGGGGGFGGGAGGGQIVLGRKVYITGLPNDSSWQDVKDHFRQANVNVLFADVQLNNQGQAYGIVELGTAHEALRCITALSNTAIKGRNILVREYREQPQNGFGGGGGFGAFNQGNAFRSQGRGGPQGGGSGCQVVVHGLPWSYTWQMLKDWFREVGAVARADIVIDQQGRSRGYGTVAFNNPADAQRAIETFNGSQLEGRIVAVKLDKFA